MYKVLYQPGLGKLVPGASAAFAAIVYDGKRGLRSLIISMGETAEQRTADAEKFEIAVSLLNVSSSSAVLKERLRSLALAARQAGALRRRQPFPGSRENFRADFGRMDIGLNPGWGRD